MTRHAGELLATAGSRLAEALARVDPPELWHHNLAPRAPQTSRSWAPSRFRAVATALVWRGSMRTNLALIVGIGLSVVARPLLAHHSFAAEFDAAKPFTLTGAVTKVVWANPHAWLYVDVVDAATNKTTNWAVELNSPN